eukprot:5072699-Pyramimonas_sp.AAC.1
MFFFDRGATARSCGWSCSEIQARACAAAFLGSRIGSFTLGAEVVIHIRAKRRHVKRRKKTAC